MNGKFSKGYARLAKSYTALGDYERALEAHEKASQAAPTDTELIKEQKTCRVVFDLWLFFSFKMWKLNIRTSFRKETMLQLLSTCRF